MAPIRKTSTSHPLLIDFVEVGDRGAKLGMTLCPGKHQPDGSTGWWERDLESDLVRIAASGAAALVTLMEEPELEDMKVPAAALAQAASKHGIEWHHLPIRDGSVPDSRFHQRWPVTGARLRGHLRAGRSVVIHCKGGLGRSGMIAARLLVELGWDPEHAIKEVRRARPGAIETAAQEEHVRRLKS